MNEKSICCNNAHLNITYDGGRVKWTNSLELLKEFVKTNLMVPGQWTSPGDQSRRFKSTRSDVCIAWYQKSKKPYYSKAK